MPPEEEIITTPNFSVKERTFAKTDFKVSHFNFWATRGASQTLDGIHWHDITFVGVHIIYRGGDLDLQNVRFVNCTFEVPTRTPQNSRVERFIDYAALGETQLSFSAKQNG
jgi:hypothetical protein